MDFTFSIIMCNNSMKLPIFAIMGFDAVRPAIHPCRKLQGILAKASEKGQKAMCSVSAV